MNMFEVLKGLQGVAEFEQTSNYYYEYHNCPVKGENTKVMLDYTLSSDVSDEILKIGVCPHCGKGFYHKDYQSKNF